MRASRSQTAPPTTAGDTLSTILDKYATGEQAAAEHDKAAAARQAEVLMGVFIAIAIRSPWAPRFSSHAGSPAA